MKGRFYLFCWGGAHTFQAKEYEKENVGSVSPDNMTVTYLSLQRIILICIVVNNCNALHKLPHSTHLSEAFDSGGGRVEKWDGIALQISKVIF